MKFCNVTIPDNPLEEMKKSWNNNYHIEEFSIQKLWNEPPINWKDIPIAKTSKVLEERVSIDRLFGLPTRRRNGLAHQQ
jgi:hypothetical protein